MCGVSAAIARTSWTWATVPGLNALSQMPAAASSSSSASASALSGIPAEMVTPLIGAPAGPRLLHEPLAAHLQVPQVRVQVERVEHDLLPRLEALGHLGHALGEDALGDLAAAGQLGDVAAVGRRDDDRGLGRRGRHPGQDHRGATRQPRVQVGQAQLTSGVADHPRREALVGLGDRRRAARGEQRHAPGGRRRIDHQRGTAAQVGGGLPGQRAQRADHDRDRPRGDALGHGPGPVVGSGEHRGARSPPGCRRRAGPGRSPGR